MTESLDWKDSGFALAGCVLNAWLDSLPTTRGIKNVSLTSEQVLFPEKNRYHRDI